MHLSSLPGNTGLVWLRYATQCHTSRRDEQLWCQHEHSGVHRGFPSLGEPQERGGTLQEPTVGEKIFVQELQGLVERALNWI